MQIFILKETAPEEQRVALVPQETAKLCKIGVKVTIEKSAGEMSGFSDDSYHQAGALIADNKEKAIKNADIIIKIRSPKEEPASKSELTSFKKNQILIALLDARNEGRNFNALAKTGIDAFALDLIPRITRAQSMDVLSSQTNLAGYKAAINAAELYKKAIPMMMTAAGTIQPARVFIMGVGVAGLQAIATARRLGAIVSATDVRADTKEQVQSLGAKFLEVEVNAQQEKTVYAGEMSAEYRKKQAEAVKKTLPQQDIVITTALIPGRKAPILLDKEAVGLLKAGSVVMDMAGEAGGNCVYSSYGKTINKDGVVIAAPANLASELATSASQMFSRNVYHFLQLFHIEDKFHIDEEDEIIKAVRVTHNGQITDAVAGKKNQS